jgi:hypothetical protein
MKISHNIPSLGKVIIDLNAMTPFALAILRDGLDATLARSTEPDETKEVATALEVVEKALAALGHEVKS